MTSKHRYWPAGLALLAAALACNFGTPFPTEAPPIADVTSRPAATARPTSTPRPSPTPKPTEEPTEEPTEAASPTAEQSPTARPSRTPRATAETTYGEAFTISSEAFVHDSGAFAINLPEGWEVNERSDGLFAESEDGSSSLDVSFTKVGVEFDAESLDVYIQAIEANWFGNFANYSQEAYELQSDGSIGVLKTVEGSDGTPQTVLSYYEQHGVVVYQQDYWTTTDEFDAFMDSFVEVANTLQYDEVAGAEAPLYEFVYTYTDPSGLFEFLVPYGWTFTQDESEDGTVRLDTWTSPDGVSLIENLTYDEGIPISRSEAGDIALELLRTYYTDDVAITDDQVQSDGSERLIWYSPGGGYSGMSFFEVRDTAFLLLTWYVADEYADVYSPVWESTVDSYVIP